MNKKQRIDSILDDLSIQYWIDSFLLDRRIRGLQKTSLRFYSVKLERFNKYCNDVEVSDMLEISPVFLKRYIVYLQDVEGKKAGGVNCQMRAVKAFLNFFAEEIGEDLPQYKSPTRKIKQLKQEQQPLEPISLDQFQRILRACKGNKRDVLIFSLLLETGLRASELLSLRLEDLSINSQSFLVKGKGGKIRSCVFGRKLKRLLKAYLKGRGTRGEFLIIKSTGEQLTYMGLRSLLVRKSKKAKVEGVCLHDFRRAFCLSQLQHGTPETTIARLMGHSNTQLIATYAKQTTRDLVETFYSTVDEQL